MWRVRRGWLGLQGRPKELLRASLSLSFALPCALTGLINMWYSIATGYNPLQLLPTCEKSWVRVRLRVKMDVPVSATFFKFRRGYPRFAFPPKRHTQNAVGGAATSSCSRQQQSAGGSKAGTCKVPGPQSFRREAN